MMSLSTMSLGGCESRNSGTRGSRWLGSPAVVSGCQATQSLWLVLRGKAISVLSGINFGLKELAMCSSAFIRLKKFVRHAILDVYYKSVKYVHENSHT